VILGINGALFTNDARIAFVDGVVAAEATGNGGALYLTVFRPSTAVTNTLLVQLRELGTRSITTTPYDCPWAEAVLSNYCEYVYNNGPTGGSLSHPSLWTMLASGIPKYQEWACNWITNQPYASRTNLTVYSGSVGYCTWYRGYEAVTLGQYYLFSGDASVLPALQDVAHYIAQGQDRRGIWGHTFAWPSGNGGELHGTLPGYGALNQAGLVALYGMALAKKCGINDPEINEAITKSAHFFRSHVEVGSINYGFHKPLESVVDSNGRMGIAAHLFRCLDDPVASKWFAMMTASYKLRDWGHGGNEPNHCWGPMASGIGGPELANMTQSSSYWLFSLVMRRQWEGWFQSQGQAGLGKGNQNGRATGGYGVQLAAHKRMTEITGSGYSTNAYWLTEAEMEQVRFAHIYESASKTAELGLFSDEELLANFDTYNTQVAYKIANVLKTRSVTNATLRAQLVAIVEDEGALKRLRVAALNALGTSNVLVTATTDQWFYPSAGYILNWGAIRGASVASITSITNLLTAILQFNQDVGFDMLTVQSYGMLITYLDKSQFNAEQLELFYKATGFLLGPDVGAGWNWTDAQDVKNWDPLILARYADSILRNAEQYQRVYDSNAILMHNQIGEGMHSVTVRATDFTPFFPDIEYGDMQEYGQNWWPYTNYTRQVMLHRHRIDEHYKQRRIIEITTQQPAPPVQWFRYLIATNITTTLTNPATRLADLRYNMTLGPDDDLFHAVCLDEIVKHPDNVDPFLDILPAVGSTVPNIGSHWRLYSGAVELGVADTNAVTRWLDAFAAAEAQDNQKRMIGVLHVLAGKNAAEALPLAITHLTHDNDFVAMAALDVLQHVGTTNELLAAFNNFMTRSYIADFDEEERPIGYFKSDYWIYSHWDAIKAIIDRDYDGSLALADQMAASFNAFTANGVNHYPIPYRTLPRPKPFAILNPVMEDRPVSGDGNGVYAVLGIFSRTNAACKTALTQVMAKASDRFYERKHDYSVGEALISQYSIPEILANATSWIEERSRVYYLIDQLVLDRVAPTNQLDLINYKKNTTYYYIPVWEHEINRRRGLEETEGIFFFGLY
jgi:Family of unknown function (DUF6288)